MRVLMMFALLLAATPAWAEWVRVAANSVDDVFYVDPATITKVGEFRRVWMLIDYKNVKQDGSLSVKMFKELDCKERRTRDLEFLSFQGKMGDGKLVVGFSPPENWRYIAPDAALIKVLDFVCAR